MSKSYGSYGSGSLTLVIYLTLFLLKNIKEAGSRTVIVSYGSFVAGEGHTRRAERGVGVNILEEARYTVALYSTYIDSSLVLGLFLRNLVLKISVNAEFLISNTLSWPLS